MNKTNKLDDKIVNSCLQLQKEWRTLIEDLSAMKKNKKIEKDVADDLIGKLVKFNGYIVDNQELMMTKETELAMEVSTEVAYKPKMRM